MRPTLLAAVLLLAASPALADTCPTQNPGPGWVCVNGGWLPPGLAPPVTTPTPRPFDTAGYTGAPFRIGHTYRRDATGVELYIAGMGQLRGGQPVIVAECLTVSDEDQCTAPGIGRFLAANANTLGWTEVQ